MPLTCMHIKNEKQYNKVWELLDRIIILSESRAFTGADAEWLERKRFELYQAQSDYNQYNAEYKSGHAYGEKK